MSNQPLYRDLNFYQTDDYFYLVPNGPSSSSPSPYPTKALLIDRRTEAITLSAEAAVEVQNWYPSSRIHGLFGSIQLISGKYLILIKQIVEIGELPFGEPIYRIENVDLVPYRPSDLHLTDQQKIYNGQYIQMITNFFAQGPFFHLSYSYDLTHSLQHRYQHPATKQEWMYQRSDKRFVWNHYLMRDFLQSPLLDQRELGPFCIPIMYGFVAQAKVEQSVNPSKPFTYTIISRRSVLGAGTRLFYRGAIDSQGSVANFVETEQIVTYGSDGRASSSFVQIRGSIPCHWTQYPDLRYKPPPTILNDFPNEDSFVQHIDSIIPQYETIVMINLINHTGQEEKLLKKFSELYRDNSHRISNSKKIHLTCFDFHHECGHNRWDRLSVLLNMISHHIERFGYFSTTERDTFQRGCFRTNCIDSLDRTNVVQSILAKCSLEQQLTHFGVIAPGQRIEDFPQFHHLFRNLWADNADACSIQYAGTPALKTDFTRTGQRRLYGKLQDGLNSCIRYYKNNFEDGFRQDSFDLLLGRYEVRPDEGKSIPSPLARRNMLKIVTFPLFFLLAISALFFLIMMPMDSWAAKIWNLLIWFTISVMITMVMFRFGTNFVDYPTLVPLPRPPPPASEKNKYYKDQ
ncbi:hypothetical protein RDWZM_006484 [Blomia tropicalis]|uniref:Phosphatidylinositol-3-phosphatase SAC1 n=1 Tax=Blomia tropicalis TaxID=40697 RepID=A0A9Q0M801_BLOTA|nr:hypothetical protein RDWZM_006484 [Blomia tropicalis]